MLALRRRATARAGEREPGSTLRIRGDGLILIAAAIRLRAARDLPPAGALGLPSDRGRSSVLSVLLQVLHEIAQRHHGFAWRWATASEHGWRKPALADRRAHQR